MKIHLFCSDTFYSHAPVPVALQLYRGKDGHRDITDFLQDELDLFLDSGLSFGVFSGDRVVGIGVNLLFPRYYHPHYDTTRTQLTTMSTPQARGRPRAGAGPGLAQRGRRPRPAGARGGGEGPLLAALPVPAPPALRPTRRQVRHRWGLLSSVITKDNFRKKGRKFCVHLSCLAMEEELRGSHESHDIITELIGRCWHSQF